MESSESLDDFLKGKPKDFETRLRVNGHSYDVIPANDGKIIVGPEGIMGDSQKLITWEEIKSLEKKYNKE